MTAYERRISDWSSDVCSSDLFHVPTHRAGQDLGLYFAPEIDHLLRRERVIHANHVLLDDRPLVQVRRNKMRRRTDQLHAALMRAMIRLGALEAGQKRVMNIDAASLQLRSEEHTSELQSLMRISY